MKVVSIKKSAETCRVPVDYYRALEDAMTALTHLLDEGLDAETVTTARAAVELADVIRAKSGIDKQIGPLEFYPYAPTDKR